MKKKLGAEKIRYQAFDCLNDKSKKQEGSLMSLTRLAVGFGSESTRSFLS